MKTNQYHIKDQQDLDTLLADLVNKQYGEYGYTVEIKTGIATNKQKGCVHLYCRLLANELNDMGLHMTAVLNKGHEIEWTEHSAKKELWDAIMKATTGKTSVADLERNEIGEVYEKLARHLAIKLSVVVPFPSNEAPMV